MSVSVGDVQGCSGLVIALFAYPHLFNTALAGIAGEAGYEAFQLWARRIYRHPIFETVLISSITIHTVAAVYHTYFVVPKKAAAPSSEKNDKGAAAPLTTAQRIKSLHGTTGWILAAFIVGHIYATRFDMPDLRIGWTGNVTATHLLRYWFVPYYVLLGVAGFFHTFVGIERSVKRLGPLRNVVRSVLPASDTVLGRFLLLSGSLAVAGGVLAFAGFLPWIHVDIKTAISQPWSQHFIEKVKSFGLL